jgi:hypothetical protein
MPDQSGRLRRTHSEPHAGRKAQGPGASTPVTRASSRVKALARVARPIWQHGTVVSRIPPMATSAPSSRWEDSESASPGPAPKLWIPLIQCGGDAGPVPPHGTGIARGIAAGAVRLVISQRKPEQRAGCDRVVEGTGS